MWKPIVAGVDPTPEGARAAAAAMAVAQAAGTECRLVTAVRDPWVDASLGQIPMDIARLTEMALETAAARMRGLLANIVPATVIDGLAVRLGPAPLVLDDAIEEAGAELLVLGGKHHSTLGRWLAGSTVHYMVRRANIPILATGPWTGKIRRVLAAVDTSSAARPTIAAAERIAQLFQARLRLVHVVEPLPVIDGIPAGLDNEEHLRRSEDDLARMVWPLAERADTDHVVRAGPAAETIGDTARAWEADILVVGSHGRGWVDRMLIGSVTERLLNQLPTSMLVVPVSAPARTTAEQRPAAIAARR